VYTKSGGRTVFSEYRTLLLNEYTLYAVCEGVKWGCSNVIGSLPLEVSAEELTNLFNLYEFDNPDIVLLRDFPILAENANRTFVTRPAIEIPEGFCCDEFDPYTPGTPLEYPFSTCEEGCTPDGPTKVARLRLCEPEPDDGSGGITIDPPPPPQEGYWRVRVIKGDTSGNVLLFGQGQIDPCPPVICEGDYKDPPTPRPPAGQSYPVLEPLATAAPAQNFLMPGNTFVYSSDLTKVSLNALAPVETAKQDLGLECCGQGRVFTTHDITFFVRDTSKVPQQQDRTMPISLNWAFADGNAYGALPRTQMMILEMSYDGQNWFPAQRLNPRIPQTPLPPTTELNPGECRYRIDLELSVIAEIPITIDIITPGGTISQLFEITVETPSWVIEAGTVDLPCAGTPIYNAIAAVAEKGIDYTLNFVVGKVVKKFLPLPAQVILNMLSFNVNVTLTNLGNGT